MHNSFPRSAAVWPGSILATVVNSIMTATYPEYEELEGWTGKTYWIQGWDGRYGAISFDGPFLVGTFFSAKSNRSPYHDLHYDLTRFFQGFPESHRRLAEQGALLCWRDEDDTRPLITTAFWDDGEYLTAADSWDVVLANGADLVCIHFIEKIEEALAEWQKE